MISLLPKNRRITVSPTTVKRLGISLLVIAGSWLPAISQTPGVASSVERKIYLQKPAEPVQQAQAIAPPAPQPILQPLTAPNLQPLQPLTPNFTLPAVQPTPGMQFVQKEEPKSSIGFINQATPATVNLDPPKREDVFRFDDDVTMRARIRREIATQKKLQEIKLPESVAGPSGPYIPRSLAPMQVMIEPAYVAHRKLHFEQKNTERAGWDLGLAQPIVSAAHFYSDCLFWPHKLASNCLEQYDTSAGKTLPGCPTPLLLYPPEITVFGGTVGTAVVLGTAAILP